MSFNDDDLIRLKANLDNPGLLPDEIDKQMLAIIARLEAAEAMESRMMGWA